MWNASPAQTEQKLLQEFYLVSDLTALPPALATRLCRGAVCTVARRRPALVVLRGALTCTSRAGAAARTAQASVPHPCRLRGTDVWLASRFCGVRAASHVAVGGRRVAVVGRRAVVVVRQTEEEKAEHEREKREAQQAKKGWCQEAFPVVGASRLSRAVRRGSHSVLTLALRACTVACTQRFGAAILVLALIVSSAVERVTFKVMVDKLENYRCATAPSAWVHRARPAAVLTRCSRTRSGSFSWRW